MKKRTRKKKTRLRILEESNDLLKKGGMSDEEIVTGRLQNQMQRMIDDNIIITRLMTACGEVLRDEFSFSQEDLAKFAEAVSKIGREIGEKNASNARV